MPPKLALAKEHFDFFYKQRCIEFEGLIKPESLAAVRQEILDYESELEDRPPDWSILIGKDLWKTRDEAGRIARNPQLGEIISHLFERKPIRLAYDLLLKAPKTHFFGASSPFSNWMHPNALNSLSSIEGLLGGFLLNVSPKSEDEYSGIFPIPFKDSLFFDASVEVNWPGIARYPGSAFLLVGYAEANACYKLNEKDPYTHFLKHEGYIVGSRLPDKLFPVVFR